jgi:ATP-binding cassette, subfamily C, bacterial
LLSTQEYCHLPVYRCMTKQGDFLQPCQPMKFQCVLQHSEEDCGAACLASIAKFYGNSIPLNRTREAVGTGQLGSSLLGLKRGAETLGFQARMVKTSPDILQQLHEIPLPAVIHWYGTHWVTLYGRRGKKYVIADPAVGLRYLSHREMVEGWLDWAMLIVEPDPQRFFPKDGDREKGLWRFFRQALAYRSILIEATLCALVVGLLSLTTPFLIQILTDDVLVRGDTQMLMAVAIAVVTMSLVSNSLAFIQSHLVAHFAQRLELGFILEFARTILRLPLSYFESRRSGEIVSRQRDIQEINQLISQVVVGLPSQFFIALVSFAFMLFYSWKLTIAAVVTAAVMTLTTVIFLPTLQRKVREVLVLEAQNQGLLVETFKGALVIKTTTAAPQLWEEFQMRFGKLANQTFKTTQIGITNGVFSRLVGDVSSILLLWLGSTLVISRELSIGQLLAFNGMNGNFIALISTTIGLMNGFVRVRAATQRLSEVIDATPEGQNEEQKPFATLADGADITCTNLNFHYPGRVDLLKDFSLTIPGKQVVAIIGKSGCGKSTLAKLIAGLYPLQSGNIRIGMYNLQDLALECLREQVALVPQEPHFWSRSIVENFRLGNPNLTLEQIVKACHIADADEFISRLPEKYQTVLGEFGVNLSGGQRQRLAIARAIVSDPTILILDESTGALEPSLEAKVLDRLLADRQGKTTILISHRPRVIQRADWLLLLEQGSLQLQGRPEELRNLPGEHLDFLNP